eukprot:5161335-Amphidinium_carterae.4
MVMPEHQYGVGRVTGTEYAHIAVGEALCFGKHHGLSTGVLFIDMIGAFDAIHRQLVFGCDVPLAEANAHQLAQSEDIVILPTGTSVRLALQLVKLLERHVLPLMDIPGIPDQVKRILLETNSKAWMRLPHTPGWEKLQHVPTSTGVEQGGVYSPLVAHPASPEEFDERSKVWAEAFIEAADHQGQDDEDHL